jgi:hypothetical protein
MKDVTNSQKIMLIVLGLAFLYLLYDYDVFSFGGDNTTLAKNTPSVVKVSDDVNLKSIDLLRIAKINNAIKVFKLDYNGTWELTDPFYYPERDTFKTQIPTPDDEPPPPLITFDLTGISWDGNYGFALIGEDIIQENDIINGYLVEKIASDYVLLTNEKGTIKLSLKD